ncbi:HNH endonuclease signature motif containing protein [Bacillus toyonensis]|uniref:HNH endonuclease n=1 Tax=Bacillus toyonensis TaxID=155322 RepID=UPI002E24C520|nr:HNH endonuclease signature motif containing protein [Bacillus toyonensis]
MKESLNKRNTRPKTEKREHFIKRRSKYQCVYCLKRYDSSLLRTAIEPFHMIEKYESLQHVLNHYSINMEALKKLNPTVDLKKARYGTVLRVPERYKIFTTSHGICFCEKCGRHRKKLDFDHVDYLRYLFKKRKMVRGSITKERKLKVFKRDEHKCVYCEFEYGKTKPKAKLTVDHKVPVVRGGKNNLANLVTACYHHNQQKDGLTYDEYIKKLTVQKQRKGSVLS